MPVYEYRCNACGREFEYQQRMADPDKVTCEACGEEKLERLISRTAFQLKGSGWYKDLYSSAKPDAKPSEGGEKAKTDAPAAPASGGTESSSASSGTGSSGGSSGGGSGGSSGGSSGGGSSGGGSSGGGSSGGGSSGGGSSGGSSKPSGGSGGTSSGGGSAGGTTKSAAARVS